MRKHDLKLIEGGPPPAGEALSPERHEHGFEFTSQFGWNSRRLAAQYPLRLPVGPARQPR